MTQELNITILGLLVNTLKLKYGLAREILNGHGGLPSVSYTGKKTDGTRKLKFENDVNG
jgi:hypothetical protein